VLRDPVDAARAAPDLRRVAASQATDGRVRFALSLASPFTAADLVAPKAGGPPGSLCVRLWTVTKPHNGSVPDALACVTSQPDGKTLRGTITREGADGLPVVIGRADVSRPSSQSVALRLSRAVLGRPPHVGFAAEATRPGCVSLRCVDLAPDLGATRTLRLR
jgi:hypothetical protein